MMFSKLAKAVAALSLTLSASLAAPALSADRSSGKCEHSKQKQVKRSVAPQPVRSVMIVEKRKMDVQILSFGP